MRKYLILPFLFTVLFTACEQQEVLELDDSSSDIEIEESNASFQVAALTMDDIPNVANRVLKSTSNPNILSKSVDGGDNGNDLTIDDTRILASTDSIGNISYAFRAHIPDTPYNVFYNVLVKKTSEGTLNEPFMLRYEVDEDYWETYTTSDREDATFQGNIELYPLNGIDVLGLTRSSNNGCDDPCFTTRAVNEGTGSSGGNGSSSGGSGNGSCCGGSPARSSNAGSNYSLAGVRPTGSRTSVEIGVGQWTNSHTTDETKKGRLNANQHQGFSTSRSNCNGECPEDQMLVPINEVETPPDCKSFNYVTTGSNWQESNIKGIYFHVWITRTVPPYAEYKYTVRVHEAINFGAPLEDRYGNELDPGTLASASANALHSAMKETINQFDAAALNDPSAIERFFKEQIRRDFPLHIIGGRATPNTTSNLPSSRYQATTDPNFGGCHKK